MGNIHTTEKLALELEKANLHDLAGMARKGLFHDYLSPYDFPELELDQRLLNIGTPEALAIRKRHHNGEFDATKEESDAWAESPEGKAAFAELTNKGN